MRSEDMRYAVLRIEGGSAAVCCDAAAVIGTGRCSHYFSSGGG